MHTPYDADCFACAAPSTKDHICPIHQAAPELLAACEAAAEHLNDMGCEHETTADGIKGKCVVCIVSYAIARATGEETP